MQLSVGLILDLGNSDTRMKLLTGKKAILTVLSNRYAELDSLYKVPSEYENDETTIFELDKLRYANGRLVKREFAKVAMRPSSVEDKTDQLVTDLTLNLAIVTALSQLASGYSKSPAELDVIFNISILLPPFEHTQNNARLEEKLLSMTSVRALAPLDATLNFKVSSASVYSEAAAAFFGAMYNEDGSDIVEVECNTRFNTGYTLVIDIGAGTTDVVLFEDGELLLNSKETFKKGGNTIESFLKLDVRKKFGFSPTDMNMMGAITTGYLKEGVEVEHNVIDLLDSAKNKYSKSLIEDLQGYFERMFIAMKEVSGILVVGGGAVAAVKDGVETSAAMSKVLIAYINKLSPKIQPVSIGDKPSRLLNIIGAEILHKLSNGEKV